MLQCYNVAFNFLGENGENKYDLERFSWCLQVSDSLMVATLKRRRQFHCHVMPNTELEFVTVFQC